MPNRLVRHDETANSQAAEDITQLDANSPVLRLRQEGNGNLIEGIGQNGTVVWTLNRSGVISPAIGGGGPSGPAGGVLGGSYPNPDFAVDMATQAELDAHAAAADPHTVYQKRSEKGTASGYAGLGGGGLVPIAQLGSGTPDGTKFLRDDGVLAVPGVVFLTVNSQAGTDYALVLSDVDKVVEFTNAGSVTVRVPLDIDVAFPVNTSIELFRYGVGEVTVAQGPVLPQLISSGARAAFLMHEASGLPQDSSGNANNCFTSVGSAVYGVAGIAGNPGTAISVTGTQAFKASDANSLDLGDVFTLEAVIKRNAASDAGHLGIISKGASAYYMRLNTDNKIHLLKTGVTDIVASTATITDTTSFHHVVITKNGATVAIYVDGVEGHGAVTAATCIDNVNGLTIGASDTAGPIEPANLVIAGAAVYPTEFNAATVLTHQKAWIGTGISLLSPGGGLRVNNRYSSAVLRKRAAGEWILQGDIKV